MSCPSLEIAVIKDSPGTEYILINCISCPLTFPHEVTIIVTSQTGDLRYWEVKARVQWRCLTDSDKILQRCWVPLFLWSGQGNSFSRTGLSCEHTLGQCQVSSNTWDIFLEKPHACKHIANYMRVPALRLLTKCGIYSLQVQSKAWKGAVSEL